MTTDRTSATAIRFTPGLHDRLRAASEDHGLAINKLVNLAVTDFLDRLLPANEVVWTRNEEARDD